MKVILKEYVENVGNIGDTVKVADGFARNYLLPRKLAVEANAHNIKIFEQNAAKLKKQLEEQKVIQQKICDSIQATPINISVKTGEEERLFGSVTASHIADALKHSGIEIDRKKIDLHEPIKSLGTFTIPIKLHPEITAQLQLHVIKEETESPGPTS